MLKNQVQEKDKIIEHLEVRFLVVIIVEATSMHNFGFSDSMLLCQLFDAWFYFQRDHEKMKITREREEKLIVSAWYEMVSFKNFCLKSSHLLCAFIKLLFTKNKVQRYNVAAFLFIQWRFYFRDYRNDVHLNQNYVKHVPIFFRPIKLRHCINVPALDTHCMLFASSFWLITIILFPCYHWLNVFFFLSFVLLWAKNCVEINSIALT